MAAGSKVGSAWYELNANDSKLKSALSNADKTIIATGANAEKTFAGRMSRAAAAFGEAVRRAAVVGVAALAAGLVVAVTRAAAFEKAMLNVNSIAKLSAKDFEHMKEQVLDLSLELPQSATTLAEGLYQIQSSGFAGAAGIKVLEAAAKAASAGLTTTENSAKGLTAILNAYGLTAEDAAHVSDVMFKVVDRGVLTFEELSSEIGTTTAIAASLGVPFEEVAAGLALMTRQGFNAAEATTSLSAIMSSILKPSAEAVTLANDLGLEWDVSAIKAKGLVGVLNDMIVATGGDQEKMALLLGDVRAIRGAFSLAGDGGSELSAELAIMEAAAGSTDTALSFQKKGLSYNLELLRNNLDAAAISIGTALIPAIVPLVTKLAEWLGKNQDLVASIAQGLVAGITSLVGLIGTVAGEVITVAGHIGRWVAVNQPLITQIRELAGGAFSVIINGLIGIGQAIAAAFSNSTITALTATGVAVGGLSVALGLLVAHPVIAALAALVLAIGALRIAWENDWNGMRTALIEAWPSIRGALDAIYGGIQIFARVVQGTVLGIVMMWNEMVGSIQRGAEVIVNAMATIPGPWQADMQKAGAALKGLANGTQAESDRIEAEIGVLANAPLKHLPVWTLGVSGFSRNLAGQVAPVGASAAALRGAVTRNMDLGAIPSVHGANAGARYAGGIGGQYSNVRSRANALGVSASNELSRPQYSSYSWGANLGANFASGLNSQYYTVYRSAAAIAAGASAALAIRSPAKKGPLSVDASVWGRKLGWNFARGMIGSVSDVARAAAAMGRAAIPHIGPAIGPGVAYSAFGAGGRTISISFGDINITGFSGSQAEIESVSQRLADSIRLRARSAF